MEKVSFRRFDASEYLDDEETMEEFLLAAWETNDPALIAECLGVVARARSMSQLAEEVGMGRSALYEALSGQGNPEFATIMKIMAALGLRVGSIERDSPAPAVHRETEPIGTAADPNA